MLKAAILSEHSEQIGRAAREEIDELHPDKAIPRLIEFYERAGSETGVKVTAKNIALRTFRL